MGVEKITVEVDADLMARLRAAGIDPQSYVQSVMDRKAAEGRSEAEQAETARRWAEDNQEAIDAYVAQVDRIGTFSSRQRARRG